MYSKLFTLSDLFNNKDLKNVLPQIHITDSYKEGYQTHSYKVKGFNDVKTEIKMYARIGALPYMKNVKVNDEIVVSGKLRKNATIQLAYESVLSTLMGASGSLSLLGNYGDTITDVFEKIRKSDRYRFGDKTEPKLYLRINSLDEIKFMSKEKKDALIKNVIENIYFSDDFKEYREPSMEKECFIVNKRNAIRNYDSLKRNFDRKVRY